MLSTIFFCFNMISVTVLKFYTFLVNYITLLFCQNKNISLSLSLCFVNCRQVLSCFVNYFNIKLNINNLIQIFIVNIKLYQI